MFDRIEDSIKGLAKILLGVAVILSVIVGIAVISGGDVLTGILTIIICVVGSVISSFLFYGFGELISLCRSIANDKEESARKKASAPPVPADPPKADFPEKQQNPFAFDEKSGTMTVFMCPDCGGVVPDHAEECPHCRKKIDWN